MAKSCQTHMLHSKLKVNKMEKCTYWRCNSTFIKNNLTKYKKKLTKRD